MDQVGKLVTVVPKEGHHISFKITITVKLPLYNYDLTVVTKNIIVRIVNSYFTDCGGCNQFKFIIVEAHHNEVVNVLSLKLRK